MREHITINLNTIKKLPHILRWTANWTKPLWDTAAQTVDKALLLQGFAIGGTAFLI